MRQKQIGDQPVTESRKVEGLSKMIPRFLEWELMASLIGTEIRTDGFEKMRHIEFKTIGGYYSGIVVSTL